MRLVLVSLIALLGSASIAGAQAQAPQPGPAPAPEPAPAPQPGPSPSAVSPPQATAPAVPAAPAPQTTAPAAPGAAAAAPSQPSAVAPTTPQAPAPEAPPTPPAPPTDPTAIALLDALQNVCIPAVEGGSLPKLTKAAGWRKSGDNYVYKRPGFSFTLEPSSSNPTQCQIEIVAPVDPEAAAKPLVIALFNWAQIERGYSLYRNDKNVNGNAEYITRSWEHDENGKHEALVLTTIRKADDTPSKRNAETSELIYSETPTSS